VKIAVYGIFLNEKRLIGRCVESARDADVILYADTGSTDRSGMIAKAAGATVVDVRVRPWRFDDARNLALSLLPEDVDLCISLDADEVLVEGWRAALEAAYVPTASRYNHRFESIWDWEGAGINRTYHWHERIHTRKGYMWRSPVHEYLKRPANEQVIWVQAEHFMQQLPDLTKDRSSYLLMMKQAIEEEPDQWKIFWFYWEALVKAGQTEEASRVMVRLKQIPGADPKFFA